MYVICHYSEIGLKGKNRRFFEQKLVENIKQAIQGLGFKEVRRISGRILIELESEPNLEKINQALTKVMGLAYFCFAYSCDQKPEAIQKKAVEILDQHDFKTFRITTQRSNKKFPLNSQEINEQVGAAVVEKLSKDVDLENPDLTCFIEIVEDYAFLYLNKIEGQPGLPVSTSGKAISLLSGGIDSPVASYYGMRRGIKIIFLHFTSYPFTKKSSIEKAEQVVKVLTKYQFRSKLYLVPFAEIQKEILLKTEAKLRVILYRRFMVRIAEAIAKKEQARALFTGESVGQVASQTLENLAAIEEAVKVPVLRPLIGMDKEQIIKKAKAIGTFDISILPAEDCCQRFIPDHPETKANLEEVKQEEQKLDVENLIQEAIEKIEVKII